MLQLIYFMILFLSVFNQINATQHKYSSFYSDVNNKIIKPQKLNYLCSDIYQFSLINLSYTNSFYDDLDANKDYILNNKEFSLLHLGVVTQDISMIRMALMYDRSSINSQDLNGCTALHLAVQTDNIAIVEILIRLGADINSTNNEYETPIFNAVKNDSDIIIIEYLISEGALLYGKNKSNQSLEDIINLYKRDHLKSIIIYSSI